MANKVGKLVKGVWPERGLGGFTSENMPDYIEANCDIADLNWYEATVKANPKKKPNYLDGGNEVDGTDWPEVRLLFAKKFFAEEYKAVEEAKNAKKKNGKKEKPTFEDDMAKRRRRMEAKANK